MDSMRISRVSAFVRGRFAFWALAGVAFLASHDAIYLAQVGPGEQLARAVRQAGHDYWAAVSLLLAAVGIAAAISTLLRLRSLRRRATGLAGSGSDRTGGSRARLLSMWAKLFAVVAFGFVLQENVEHLVVHGHAPGLGALVGPEYPLAVPVIGLISAIAASIAAALRGAEQELLAAIQAGLRRPLGQAPRRLMRPSLRIAATRMSPLARATAGRAPPPASVHAT